MQFKHPELLYFLFLLLIPIFIHLFQLRRFQKIAFTNVSFLKKVSIQTRKSSQLKKWITLLTRLLALACVIVAFAQPFKASNSALNSQKETVLYIDNSFSMQAKGNEGPLLQRALQQLFALPLNNNKISWFTNDYSKKNVSPQDFKNDVLGVQYTQKQLNSSQILLKANQLFSKNENIEKRLIIVSDFQLKDVFPPLPKDIKVDAVHLQSITDHNISIDTVYIAAKNTLTTQLKVVVSKQSDAPETVPISLYNDKKLIAKTSVDFSDLSAGKTGRLSKIITLDIENTPNFRGKLELYEPNLPFDNILYFSINTPQKIKVLSINEANSNFLQRIFNQQEFEYNQQSYKNLNYSEIPNQNLIVLNELTNVPESLGTAIKSFSENGGSILIIPLEDGNLKSLNSLLAKLQMGAFSEKIIQEKKITKIIFDHPLYHNVFEKQVVNFQYPKVNSFYNSNSQATAVLKFEDQKPFILQYKNTYVCTAPINTSNSNFQNSPLIVPTFYNMAQLSLPLSKLFYTIGNLNSFAIPIKLVQDEILTLRDSTSNIIPLQQSKATQVNITTTTIPAIAGIYSVEKKGQFIENVSYNYNREESVLQFANPKDWEGVNVYDSVFSLYDTLIKENSISSYWKWFVIFALLFLITEMLILKFYK